MRLLRYALCFLFYGHARQRIIHQDVENRITLVQCDRCERFEYRHMWFDDWFHLISDEERAKFMDEHRYNPLGTSHDWSEWVKKDRNKP